MVNLTKFLRTIITNVTPNPYIKVNDGFKDSLRVYCRGGAGGNGLPKFGGIGGKGGDVIAVAKENINLYNVVASTKKTPAIAGNGRHSTHNFILGTPGQDVIIEVPIGVSLYAESGAKIGDLNELDEKLKMAWGGFGGTPRNGYKGTEGQEHYVFMDLKLIADIGLVGFPNAGKSTLLKAVSHAKPKIASYPFTTINPNVGIIKYRDYREISVADLPGLIEGSYANRGMGHRFLKHVERTKLMLIIADINGFQLNRKYLHRSCLENVLLLNKELELYNKDLLLKPTILLINKMDTEGSWEKFNKIKHILANLSDNKNDYPVEMCPEFCLKFLDILPVSMKNSLEDADRVQNKLRELLDAYDEMENEEKTLETNQKLMEELQVSTEEKGPHLT